MRIKKASLYYADGSRIDVGGDDDEVVYIPFSKKWVEAPSDGLVFVVAEDSVLNRTNLQDLDYFYQMPINGHGAGTYGTCNSLGAFLRHLGVVKFGAWTDTDNYESVKRRARTDVDYIAQVTPRKTLHDSRED